VPDGYRSAPWRIGLLALAAALLAGCAGYGLGGPDVPPGTPREAVLARLGQPTRVVPLPDGERLQYSLQPAGQHAWMVDLDRNGQVVGLHQALTAARLQQIQPGQWSRADVEREFGPPASIDTVGNWHGPIMAYRWNDGVDMFYWVYLDGHNVVQRAHPGMEFKDPNWE
jgi:hypothetical protein